MSKETVLLAKEVWMRFWKKRKKRKEQGKAEKEEVCGASKKTARSPEVDMKTGK
jgi:hypothetical protein